MPRWRLCFAHRKGLQHPWAMWHVSSPNDAMLNAVEDCVERQPSSGRWADARCTDAQKYYCEGQIFTARKRSCGKVMFLHVFVCPKGRRCIHPTIPWGRGCIHPTMQQGMGCIYPTMQWGMDASVVHSGGVAILVGCILGRCIHLGCRWTAPTPPPDGCTPSATDRRSCRRAVHVLLECILVSLSLSYVENPNIQLSNCFFKPGPLIYINGVEEEESGDF